MFKKILVALDRSSQASTVVDFALAIAQPKVSQMLLLHFIDWQMREASAWVSLGTLYDIDLYGDRYDWNRENLQTAIEQGQNWLQTYVDKAIALEIDCKSECRVGDCSLGIGNLAQAWEADLIVTGRRGHSNISEILLGSVSNYVIHHAPCSVLVVQNQIQADELSKTDAVSMRRVGND